MHKKLLICFASVDASVVQLGGGTRQAPGRGAGSCIVNTSNTPPAATGDPQTYCEDTYTTSKHRVAIRLIEWYSYFDYFGHNLIIIRNFIFVRC